MTLVMLNPQWAPHHRRTILADGQAVTYVFDRGKPQDVPEDHAKLLLASSPKALVLASPKGKPVRGGAAEQGSRGEGEQGKEELARLLADNEALRKEVKHLSDCLDQVTGANKELAEENDKLRVANDGLADELDYHKQQFEKAVPKEAGSTNKGKTKK